LYVVIYSPIQMAADLPENYINKPAFQFIRDVGVDWERTVALNGEVGDYVTIAREERGTGNWFVGGITDENKREITVNFNFLPEGKKYKAVIYQDTKDSHYKDNPTAIDIVKMEVDRNTTQIFKLAEGGGFAISLIPVK
ncbi:MAG: glycoside hydrolase family 97 C-terminal domain-containing protein, partial [Cytophagaceae bacterium]|nr:glycoside hydrolase family 97 C-terminal domain-containing protein [Cytophagaceae bacterium]